MNEYFNLEKSELSQVRIFLWRLKFEKENYEIKEINAYDMFPNTYHVETVCILKMREDV